MKYFKKLIGKRVYLSPINTEDLETYTRWLNDYEVSRNLDLFSQMISLTNERKTLEQMTSEGQHFAIILAESDTLLGNISLNEVNPIRRTATLGLFIGEADSRGKGYGAEAIRLIVDYGFKTLNLHNIMLNVNSDNKQGIACYKKVGFREFGRRREAVFVDGKYVDNLYMEILSGEMS